MSKKEAKRTKKPAKEEVSVSAEEYEAALARIEERCSSDFLDAIQSGKIPGLKESSDIVAFSQIENKKKMNAVERVLCVGWSLDRAMRFKPEKLTPEDSMADWIGECVYLDYESIPVGWKGVQVEIRVTDFYGS